jgi:hypothetical protein
MFDSQGNIIPCEEIGIKDSQLEEYIKTNDLLYK